MSAPVPLPPSRYDFDPAEWPDDDCVVAGADLLPPTIVDAYRHGAFPMPQLGRLLWWSPMLRGVLEPGSLRVTRSMRRSARHLDVTVDTAFEQVIDACGDRRRPDGWITREVRDAYLALHELGWVHSVESWREGRLAGGLYGVAIGGLFAGESMFHRLTDASKVALVGLIERLRRGGAALLDVQWVTPHLRSLGAVEVSRAEYLERLTEAVRRPLPPAFVSGSCR
jgi:leucyl/phenylalanyl-tRNA---protein transferase